MTDKNCKLNNSFNSINDTLDKIFNFEERVDFINSQIANGDYETRLSATVRARSYNNSATIQHLTIMVENLDLHHHLKIQLCGEALSSLAKIVGSPLLPFIRKNLAIDNELWKLCVINSLEYINNEDALPIFFDLLYNCDCNSIRISAALQLALRDRPDGVPLLSSALECTKGLSHYSILCALSRLKIVHALNILEVNLINLDKIDNFKKNAFEASIRKYLDLDFSNTDDVFLKSLLYVINSRKSIQ